MYLTASNFFWSHEENASIKEAREIIAKTLGLKNAGEVQSVKLNLGYWRKVNWIHNWFVVNVQNDNDDCGEYYVTREQLAELKELCDKILASREQGLEYAREFAMEHLPPVDGFFFGKDTVEDNYYWGSLAETSNLIHDILSRPQLAHFDFHYSSSW
jgi:DNA-directed RNA polymerase subunit F